MTDTETVQAVIARLNGEEWYRVRDTHEKVLGIPYLVAKADGETYWVRPNGEESKAYVSLPPSNAFERCNRPVFPLSSDIWDYDNDLERRR